MPRAPKEGTTVLVAYDGGLASARALDAFRVSGLARGRTAHVVSVSADAGLATRRAAEAARFLRFYDIPAEAHPLPAAAPAADLIAEQAERHDAGLIVLGAFGRSRLGELFARSTTSCLLQRSDRVLFCHG